MSMAEYPKPIPVKDHVTERFWESAREHRLLIQRCGDCDAFQFFPQTFCRVCLSDRIEWVESSGRGQVYSYTIVHRSPNAGFDEDVPYSVALIDLQEGVRMMSNVVEIEPQDLHVGMPVEVVFEDITPIISLPKFRPIARSKP
jgi:uncharacterized OB-fold protein